MFLQCQSFIELSMLKWQGGDMYYSFDLFLFEQLSELFLDIFYAPYQVCLGKLKYEGPIN